MGRSANCDAAEQVIRVGVICGGQSAEHEVSLRSARAIVNALSESGNAVELIYIGRDGTWRRADPAAFLAAGDAQSQIVSPYGTQPTGAAQDASPGSGALALVTAAGQPQLMDVTAGSQLAPLDVVFPVLHGPLGEDGTIQGLLRLAGVPFVGAGVLGSAVSMDKDVAKRLLRDADCQVARFEVVRGAVSDTAAAQLAGRLGLPLFVKPANLGSSVGVSRVRSVEELGPATELALRYDTKALVEEQVVGRELEISVLGNDELAASVVGEVVTGAGYDFYTYDAKYVDDDGAELRIPARLLPGQQEAAQELACKVCTVLGVDGMARVDFFLRDDGVMVINEVNTIPGFTEISMYAKLWEASGVPFAELLQRLIALAVARHERQQQLRQ